MARTKNEVLTIRTTAEVKALVRLAAERERRTLIRSTASHSPSSSLCRSSASPPTLSITSRELYPAPLKPMAAGAELSLRSRSGSNVTVVVDCRPRYQFGSQGKILHQAG